MGELLSKDKKNFSNMLKNYYFPESKYKIHLILAIKDSQNLTDLLQWLQILPINVLILWNDSQQNWANMNSVTSVKQDLLPWFDAILTDNDFEWLHSYFAHGIVPILPKNHYLKTIVSEFDAMEWTGNAFLYDENNLWSMYYALIRYIENYKFPYDNKVLVKNVTSL